ncbi:MAG: tetratricopeptide repeat protein [Gammaproteobacteria bacterium]|nr:tetratricopeptide repeat protein [Gammaproteobacteria bacterium]
MAEHTDTQTFNPDQLRAEAAVRRAARAGNPEAQFRLGVMYGNGDGVGLDYVQALAWFEKAAEQNHENALITMAWMFANGAGVDADEERARELYLRAARLGSAKAQYVVGTMYRFAQYGVAKDVPAAVDWYLKAANQGMATAQFALGKMLMEGKGVMRDDAAALQWLSLAHVNGSKRAEDYVKHLIQRMDAGDVQAVRERMLTAADGSAG